MHFWCSCGNSIYGSIFSGQPKMCWFGLKTYFVKFKPKQSLEGEFRTQKQIKTMGSAGSLTKMARTSNIIWLFATHCRPWGWGNDQAEVDQGQNSGVGGTRWDDNKDLLLEAISKAASKCAHVGCQVVATDLATDFRLKTWLQIHLPDPGEDGCLAGFRMTGHQTDLRLHNSHALISALEAVLFGVQTCSKQRDEVLEMQLFRNHWLKLDSGERSDFSAQSLPSVARCSHQSKRRWTSTPSMSPRSLCTMPAAAAMMAVCQKCTTLDVQPRKPSYAWNATFAARLVLLACAVDAVHSDAWIWPHASKHRASAFAACPGLHSHQIMKCLACSTCASWIASPGPVAASGWVTWSARKCHGSQRQPRARRGIQGTDDLISCMELSLK